MNGNLAVGGFVWIERRQCEIADPDAGAGKGRLCDTWQEEGRERIPVPEWTWR